MSLEDPLFSTPKNSCKIIDFEMLDSPKKTLKKYDNIHIQPHELKFDKISLTNS